MDLDEQLLMFKQFEERQSLLSEFSRVTVKNLDRGFHDPLLRFDTDHPEQNVSAIAESKNYVKLCQSTPNKFNTILASNLTMQVVVDHINLSQTEERLENLRKIMHKRNLDLAQQWKHLERDEEQLRNNFIEFDKFAKENNRKRIRAQAHLDYDRKTIAARQQKIDELEKLRKEMEETMAKMEKWIEGQRIYKDFLEKLMYLGPEFKTTLDIVDRYKCLVHVKKLMISKQRSNTAFFEHSIFDTMKLIEEKNFVIMGLNNQIANLQARYENANIKALESEELVTEIKNNAVKQLSEIDTVKTSIWNVYVHMTLSKKHPIKIKKDNVEEQMMYINRTLTELSKVNKLIKKKSTKTK